MSGGTPRRGRRGRPLKFGRPARSVTITLPDDVLMVLRARDRDVGRAVVGLLAAATSAQPTPRAVVLHQTGRRAVIVVRPVEALRRIPGVELVSLGDPDRALIAFTGGLSVSAFELKVQDLLDGAPLAADDANVIALLVSLLRDVRRTAGRTLSEATIVVVDDAPSPAPAAAVRGGRRGTGPRPREPRDGSFSPRRRRP